MLKKMTLLAMIVSLAGLMLASCAAEKAADTATGAKEMTIAEFNANAADLVDQIVTVSGTVDHVCKHSGKRVFIFGEDPQDRLKIEAGEKVGTFDVGLEGSEIRVQGKVLEMRVDAAYLDEWEKEEVGEDCTADLKPESDGEPNAGAKPESAAMDRITALRKQLAESGKGYIGFYSLECVSFAEMQQED